MSQAHARGKLLASALRALGRPVLLGLLALLLGFALFSNFDGIENGLVGRNADAASRAQARATLGLDQPFGQRLLSYLQAAISGDLGRSWVNGEPVARILKERLPITGLLVLPGFLLGHCLALWLASRERHQAAIALLANTSLALGGVLLAVLAQSLLSPLLGLPMRGLPTSPWSTTVQHLLLPTLVLTLTGFGFSYLHFRSHFQQALTASFALAALARGQPGGARGAALLQMRGLVLTRVLFALPVALISATVIETLFAVPGMSQRLVQAILNADQPVVLGLVLVMALVFSLLRAVLNLMLMRLDPRLLHA